MVAKFGIGQAVRRVEDQRFLTGQGQYVDDINLPHQAYGLSIPSPHAHAHITNVDTSKAKAAPGVLLVLTGANAKTDKLGSFTDRRMPPEFGAPTNVHRTLQPILNADKVRFVGERVAYIVAETLAQARDAAELVEITYEPLPSVVNLEEAAKPDAPKVFDECQNGNIAFALAYGSKDRADAAFASAPHIIRLRLEHNRLSPNPMEPRAAVGDYATATDQYTLYTTSQNPHGVRADLSHILGVSETGIRVVAPDVGGGFGLKASASPDDVLVLWAARNLGRPVKWTATRSDSLLTDNHGREAISYGELALDENGRILGLRSHTLYQAGAYFVGSLMAPASLSQRFIAGAYDIQNLYLTLDCVFTNTAQVGPYRGAGRPEATYIMERLIDRAARVLGLDPEEIRRRNMIPPARLPYATPTLAVYDSGEFEYVMDSCLAASDWQGYAARKAASARSGKIRGRSVIFYIEQGGLLSDRMDLRFDPSGGVTVLAGTHSHGQGHATVFAQLVHEWLGVPFESIRYVQGDTGRVAIGRGGVASRCSMVGSNGLRVACDAIIERGKRMAAVMMEAAPDDIEFSDGEFRIAGTDRKVGIIDVAKAYYVPIGPTEQLGLGLEAQGFYNGRVPNHPNGAHVCELEIDPETGVVTIDRYFVVDDVGRALNPLIIKGQVHGGVTQGIGQALLEQVLYDSDSGQLLTGSFMDYSMPRADILPDIESRIAEIPAKTNPVGVKSIGESGTIGAPAAVINAILDALEPLGVTEIDMPATPQRVWDAIQRAQARHKR